MLNKYKIFKINKSVLIKNEFNYYFFKKSIYLIKQILKKPIMKIIKQYINIFLKDIIPKLTNSIQINSKLIEIKTQFIHFYMIPYIIIKINYLNLLFFFFIFFPF